MYPSIEPFARGHLVVSGGDEIYWETSGNPDGTPAVYLHGGPGAGLGAGGYRRRFDPEHYLIVGIDQRGCGRSLPLAIDALADLDTNTTGALIGDIEEVREQLGVEAWVVTGASWGTTLALAYAQAHPDRVTCLVLVAVTTTSHGEVDWITEHIGRVFPEAWDKFERASRRSGGERLVDAYAGLLRSPNAADRQAAAEAWDAWESTHVSLDPNGSAGRLSAGQRDRANFATLVSHYWAHDGFLTGADAILANMHVIGHIPGVLIHGRHDISGPAITAWRIHRAWPASELVIIESEGHGGPLSMDRMRVALDSFA